MENTRVHKIPKHCCVLSSLRCKDTEQWAVEYKGTYRLMNNQNGDETDRKTERQKDRNTQ